jgi:CheY-like chemotaxis protein
MDHKESINGPLANDAVASSNHPESNGRATRIARVLIVEDNDGSREMLKMLLELDGFEVTAAENGPDGLAAFQRQRPDVALIDIGLPGIDGYQVARQIRGEPENDGVRLVALTGYGRPEDHERVIAAGFDAHLVKPIQVEELYPLLSRRMQ